MTWRDDLSNSMPITPSKRVILADSCQYKHHSLFCTKNIRSCEDDPNTSFDTKMIQKHAVVGEPEACERGREQLLTTRVDDEF